MWTPISLEELNELVADSISKIAPRECRVWELLRVEAPVKWQFHPWGDMGGGFWVVGILGNQALWYNDIEDGFNVSHYSTFGVLGEYWCNQDELHHVLYRFGEHICNG
jgi:hypothetical protein